MYQKLEEAIESLQFLQHHSLMTIPMKYVAADAIQCIREYIEEGYKMRDTP